MIKSKIRYISGESVAAVVIAFLVFIAPLPTAIILNIVLFWRIRKDSDLMRAVIVPGATLLLILFDNFVPGRQEYLRLVVWSGQAVALYAYYTKVRSK